MLCAALLHADGVDKLLLGNAPSPVGARLNSGQFYPTAPFMFSSQQITLGSTPASSGFYPAIIPDFIYTKCYRTPAAPGAKETVTRVGPSCTSIHLAPLPNPSAMP